MNEPTNRKFSTAVLKRNWQRINTYMKSYAKEKTLYPVASGSNIYWLSEDGRLEPAVESSIVVFKLYF